MTHDFEDAASLSGRVGVIVDGRLRQLASPQELVARPADGFVAAFTGANLLHGTAAAGAGGLTVIRLDGGETIYSADRAEGPVEVVVYPWEISVGRVHQPDSAQNVIAGEIRSIVHVGNRVRLKIGPVTAEVTASAIEQLGLVVGADAVASFKATGTRLVPFS